MTNKKAWIMLIPLALFLMYDFTQMDIMNSFAPYLIHLLHIQNTELGFVSSLYFWINVLGLLVAGFLLDRYSPKWLVIISVSVSLLGLLAFIFSSDISTLMIWRALGGIAGAFSYLSVVKLLAMHFPRNRIGMILGFSGFSIMLAGMLAQTPMILLLEHVGILSTLWINFIAGLWVVVLCYALIPHAYTPQHSAASLSPKPQEPSPYLSLKNWCLALFASLDNLPLFVLGALWGNLYLTHVYHFTTTQASVIVMMMFLGNIFGAPTMGCVSDHVGSRGKVMLPGAILIFMITGTLYLLPIHNVILVGVLFFMVGFFLAVQTVTYAAAIDNNPSHHAAKATSLICFLSVLGGALMQPLFGWLTTQASNLTTGYRHGMLIIVLADAMCVILALLYVTALRNSNKCANLSKSGK